MAVKCVKVSVCVLQHLNFSVSLTVSHGALMSSSFNININVNFDHNYTWDGNYFAKNVIRNT